MAKKRTPSRKPSDQPSAKREGVPQPHGGLLIPGAGGGPQPGSGRPPGVIREQLRGNFAERMAFLNAVIDGDVMQTVELPLGRVASLLRCPHCDRAGLDLLVSEAQASSQTVRVKASATVNDRLKAVDLQAKYGLGTSNETATTLKDERVLTREERETRALTLLKGTKTG